MKKSQHIYNQVVELLKLDARYRDDDSLLCCKFWWNSIDQSISAKDFLLKYKDGKITPADIITRLRRKAQELNPELRGASYNERQTHKVKKAKQEIREIV